MPRSMRGKIFLAVVSLSLALPGIGGRSLFAQVAPPAQLPPQQTPPEQAPREQTPPEKTSPEQSPQKQAPREKTADEKELDDQGKAIGRQILFNMVRQGINPADFFGQMMRDMPVGDFDADALRQKLIDNHLIDSDALDRIDATFQRVATAHLQERLGVQGGAEWDLIRLRIQSVLDTGYLAGVKIPGYYIIGMRPDTTRENQVATALAAVDSARKDPGTTPKEIFQKIERWHTLKKEAMAEYVEAQHDLIAVCNPQQEGFLLGMGLVD